MPVRPYHASCKCGSVRYAASVNIDEAVRCICARCRGLGIHVAHLNRANFRLLTGADNLTESLRDARTPHHFFCKTCGEAGFGFSSETVTVNIACLERGDVEAIASTKINPVTSIGK